MENTPRAAGPVQTGALPRVLRELIRTPLFRELLKLNLKESPPGSAAELARTILMEDVDITLSLLGSSPQALNFLSEFLLEAVKQFQNFPPEMLREFLRQMSERVDKETLQALPVAFSQLADDLVWVDPETVRALKSGLAAAANSALWAASGVLTRLETAPGTAPMAKEKGAGLDPEALAGLINTSVRSLGRALAERPGYLREVVSHIDSKAVRKAADGALNAFIEARIPLLSMAAWACRAFCRVIKAKLKR